MNKMGRVYNFGAGPSMMPLEVLEQAQRELLDYQGCGMSRLEISHRNPLFSKVNEEAQADIKKLLGMDDSWVVMFMGGGATLQFSMVPMNFLNPGKVGAYAITSSFSEKAIKEAKKVGETIEVFSSKATGLDRVPLPEEIELPDNAAYLHITGNNTIEGTEYQEYPDTGDIPLIADLSSDILSKPIPIDKFSLIYNGAQKNIGPAGVVVVMAKKEFLKGRDKNLPIMMNYETYADHESLYNTPPVFGIYMVGLMAKWLLGQGGLVEVQKHNIAKAKVVYDALDAHPDFYKPHALKGHRSIGGIRASIYNAMPLAGCEALANYMEDFYQKNK